MRRIASGCVFGLAMGLVLGGLAAGAEPANPAASPKARAVLDYVESLPRRSEKRLVSGQFSGFGSGASLRDCEAAHRKTGRWPAMIGLDYAEFRTGGLGLDAYTAFVDPRHILGFLEVAKPPKPFGFSEFGPHGPHNPPGDYDYLRFRDGIQAHFPQTCYFLSWDAKWGLGRNKNTKELLNHPWLVNREDLPRELAGGR